MSSQPQSRRAAASINDVAFALYRELSASANLLFSPLSIYCVVRMLQAGARGETCRALSRLLRQESYGTAPADLRSFLGELEALAQPTEIDTRRLERAAEAKRLQERDVDTLMFESATPDEPRFDLRLANAIWIQEGYPFNPEFVEGVRAMAQAEVATLDFAGSPIGSRDTMNAWVAERTSGRITSMLARVPPLTRCILGGALYFKARWEEPFGDPRPGHFYLTDGRRVDVQMMEHKFSGLNYLRGNDFWAAELPYDQRPVSMFVLVPTRRGEGGLRNLEEHVAARWADIVDMGQRTTPAVLTMPQFTIRAQYGLAGALSGLGMGGLFGPSADWSGISDEPAFQLAEIAHSTYLRADRHGTEAAAATMAVFALIAALHEPKPVVLTIDRPFLFAVVHSPSGALLLLGKVQNPAT